MMLAVLLREAALGTAIALLAGCASYGLEQRSTQGPSAEQFWKYRVALANGREPTHRFLEEIVRLAEGEPNHGASQLGATVEARPRDRGHADLAREPGGERIVREVT